MNYFTSKKDIKIGFETKKKTLKSKIWILLNLKFLVRFIEVCKITE